MSKLFLPRLRFLALSVSFLLASACNPGPTVRIESPALNSELVQGQPIEFLAWTDGWEPVPGEARECELSLEFHGQTAIEVGVDGTLRADLTERARLGWEMVVLSFRPDGCEEEPPEDSEWQRIRIAFELVAQAELDESSSDDDDDSSDGGSTGDDDSAATTVD